MTTPDQRRYQVTPRPATVGGGFKLQCFDLDGVETMGGIFDTEDEAEEEAHDWLSSQSTASDD